MSDISNVLDEVADRSETRLSEIRGVIADLRFGLHDFVQNLQPVNEGDLRHDRAALDWMHDALEDISATVTGIHQCSESAASGQAAGAAWNDSDAATLLSGTAVPPEQVRLRGNAPEPVSRDNVRSPITGPSPESTVIQTGASEKAGRTVALPVVIHASTPAQLQEDISSAVGLVRLKAVEEGRHGILVTQHSYTEFTVTISQDVPYGVTMEAGLDRPHPRAGEGR